MKLTLFSLALLFSTGLVTATPTDKKPPEKPNKPEKPTVTVVNQSNQCGNNNQPYCCASDGKGSYSYCSAMSGSSICSQTIVCCNANNSVQTCIGNSNVEERPW